MATYIVIGLISGVIYGLAALGLVLIYKGSRIFNFAQGEFGTVAMYTMFGLTGTALKLSYFAAVPIALMVGIVLGLSTERLIVRPLSNAPKVISLVGTAGAALLMVGLELALLDPEPRSVSGALKGAGPTVFGFTIPQQSILALIVLLAIAAASAWFFKKTFLGMAILANSQDAIATRIVGANPNRISMLTWGIAGFLGALTGVILAPAVPFYPGYMTTIILIPAFTAGIVGGMTSLVGAFVGGQLIGLLEAMGSYLGDTYPAFAEVKELSTVLVFFLLVLTLAIRPRGLFGSEA